MVTRYKKLNHTCLVLQSPVTWIKSKFQLNIKWRGIEKFSFSESLSCSVVTCDLWIKRRRCNTFFDVTILPGGKTTYKDTLVFPLLVVRLVRQNPGNWNSPRKKGKDWSLIASKGGSCLLGRDFTESENLSEHCIGEPGAETTKGKWWAEPPLVQDCLPLLCILPFLYLNPDFMSGSQRWT